MATWQGVNINTGTTEVPKYVQEGEVAQIYSAALTTAIANGDTIAGPVVPPGVFLLNVTVDTDQIDSAATATVGFSVGYTNAGTTVPAAFIAAGNTTARTGGIAQANVPATIGTTFSQNSTVIAVLTTAPAVAKAGNFRIMTEYTASP